MINRDCDCYKNRILNNFDQLVNLNNDWKTFKDYKIFIDCYISFCLYCGSQKNLNTEIDDYQTYLISSKYRFIVGPGALDSDLKNLLIFGQKQNISIPEDLINFLKFHDGESQHDYNSEDAIFGFIKPGFYLMSVYEIIDITLKLNGIFENFNYLVFGWNLYFNDKYYLITDGICIYKLILYTYSDTHIGKNNQTCGELIIIYNSIIDFNFSLFEHLLKN